MNEKPLVKKQDISLAIIGQTPGNGHPYSWSAMFNGYDKQLMTEECPYAGIPVYLNKQPEETLRIPHARVTHICCSGDGDFTAEHVAKTTYIDHVVSDPLDLIGKVDAVIIATDIGSEHVRRARPFVESNIPVFIDKPLVDNREDLAVFSKWVSEGRPILSSSSMRYAKEFMPYRYSTKNLGDLRYVSITTPKSWETYGIHALEAVYPIIGSGFLSAQHIGTKERNLVHYTHKNNLDLIVVASKDMYGGFGQLTLCGTMDSSQLRFSDSFFSFKSQLETFITYLRTGIKPFSFDETEELMRMLIAGIESRDAGGNIIRLDEI
jgi:hypothetical protein